MCVSTVVMKRVLNEAFRKCYAKGCDHIPKGSCVTCKKFFELKEKDDSNGSK